MAFVDDDDKVDSAYVLLILEALRSGPDLVTFDVMRVSNRAETRQTFRLDYGDHTPLPDGMIGMRANHLCAWRRDIATRVGFMPHLGYNDDVFWYTPLLAANCAQTEQHIPQVLYWYQWERAGTINQKPRAVQATRVWARGGVRAFWWQNEIVLAAAGTSHQQACPMECYHDDGQIRLLRAIGPFGVERYLPEKELSCFCRVYSKPR